MDTPAYIKSNGTATLWSWGDYRYTIDAEGVMNKIVMEGTGLETAIAFFDANFGENEHDCDCQMVEENS